MSRGANEATLVKSITRPYDEDDIMSYEEVMETCPIVEVAPRLLRPTQSMLRLDRLLSVAAGEAQEGPDPCLHVVAHDAQLWVHNGHHRWVAALLRGDRTVNVRIQTAAAGRTTR